MTDGGSFGRSLIWRRRAETQPPGQQRWRESRRPASLPFDIEDRNGSAPVTGGSAPRIGARCVNPRLPG
jgi:hypothetical protein